jgi:hypothetical protein
MPRRVIVLGSVLVLGIVATADVAAGAAQAQVHPRIAHLQALLAAIAARPVRLDAIEMAAIHSGDVFPDDVRCPQVRPRRVAAGLAQGAPQAQEVPALVELDLDLCEALAFVRIEMAVFEKPVLFSYQAFIMGEYGLVLALFFHGIPRWMQVGAMPNINLL